MNDLGENISDAETSVTQKRWLPPDSTAEEQ